MKFKTPNTVQVKAYPEGYPYYWSYLKDVESLEDSIEVNVASGKEIMYLRNVVITQKTERDVDTNGNYRYSYCVSASYEPRANRKDLTLIDYDD